MIGIREWDIHAHDESVNFVQTRNTKKKKKKKKKKMYERFSQCTCIIKATVYRTKIIKSLMC